MFSFCIQNVESREALAVIVEPRRIKMKIVISVTAAILASVPLLPTYIVCIPGVLDLWLLQEKSATALFLLLLQFAPTYFVDVAIYEDIHGYVVLVLQFW